LNLRRLLATREEDNVPLGWLYISILQNKELLDSIFLKCAELYEKSKRS